MEVYRGALTRIYLRVHAILLQQHVTTVARQSKRQSGKHSLASTVWQAQSGNRQSAHASAVAVAHAFLGAIRRYISCLIGSAPSTPTSF